MGVPYSVDFLKSMKEGVYVVNRERQITLWNDSARILTGFSEAEVLGKQCSKYVRCHVDESGENLCEEGCPLKEAMVTGKQVETIAFLKHRDDHLIKMNITAVPYHNSQGFLEGVIEIFSPFDEEKFDARMEGFNERVRYTDLETGMVNRNFMDAHHMNLLNQNSVTFEMGLILVDVAFIEEFAKLEEREHAFELITRLGEIIQGVANGHADTTVGRWSEKSFILMLNNSHPEHMNHVKEELERRIRIEVLNGITDPVEMTFQLMTTMISSDEPLEKVVDILHMRSAKLYQ